MCPHAWTMSAWTHTNIHTAVEDTRSRTHTDFTGCERSLSRGRNGSDKIDKFICAAMNIWMDGTGLRVCARWQTNELETEPLKKKSQQTETNYQLFLWLAMFVSLPLFAPEYITYASCDSIARYIGFAGGAIFFLSFFIEAQFVAQSSPFSSHL